MTIDAAEIAGWRETAQRCKDADSPVDGFDPDDILAILDELERAHADLERERMRLVACGVVAMANTPKSAAENREMHPDYWSASCDDVANAVDREMSLRDSLDAAHALLREALRWFDHADYHPSFRAEIARMLAP